VNRARYIVRFDDACPTMDHDIWHRIEAALDRHGVKPIVGVIPDNRDEAQKIDEPDPDFWDRVRTWQAKGWTIALHGYQHRFVTDDPGLFGWNARSEFAGLSKAEQEDKLGRALAIFRSQGVTADAWMAPNHSFDLVTVQALSELGIDTITDGLGLFPHRDARGTTWLPVQLWSFLPRSFGLWTVVLHPNVWTEGELERFERDLESYACDIIDVPTALARYGRRRRSLLDATFAVERRARKALARR
jgi:predicted deacetylase